MINSVSIYNCKLFERLENVPLSKVTLIGGKNNTGKTTFLETLFFYSDCKYPEVLDKLFAWRGFNGFWEPKEVFTKYFNNSALTKEIKISVNSDGGVKKQLTINYLNEYKTSAQIPVTENGITTFKNIFPAFEIKHSSNNSVDYQAYILCHEKAKNYIKEADSLQIQIPVFYMGEGMQIYEKNVEYLGILDKADEQEKILPFLKLFEPNLIRLQLINDGGNNVIYADCGNKKKIPVNMLGYGFCRCLTMALILAAENTKLFLIDEVGSGIHYSVQHDLWKFLLKAAEWNDCQIIATAHSLDTIKAFNEAIKGTSESDFSYIRLGRSNDIIKSYVFEPEILNHSLSSELEVR